MSVVVDTNVACVADGMHPGAPAVCVETCCIRLAELVDRGGLVLDDDDAIIEEYTRELGYAGRSGLGAKFVKWAHDRRFDPDCCILVRITPRADGWRRFEEVPDLDKLNGFHAKDHKFVAAALVATAPVLNATDSDWWQHAEALAEAGVEVVNLCPPRPTPGRRRRRR